MILSINSPLCSSNEGVTTQNRVQLYIPFRGRLDKYAEYELDDAAYERHSLRNGLVPEPTLRDLSKTFQYDQEDVSLVRHMRDLGGQYQHPAVKIGCIHDVLDSIDCCDSDP
jgi:hypothetical protein